MNTESIVAGPPTDPFVKQTGVTEPPQALTKECSMCVFWHSTGHSLASGTCHRFPPAALNEHQTVWPTLKFDSFCGEFVHDTQRAERVRVSEQQQEEEGLRLTKLARELYEKANRGELGVEHQPPQTLQSQNAIDTLRQVAPPILSTQATPTPTSPNQPKVPFAPVLTVDRMRQLAAARGGVK